MPPLHGKRLRCTGRAAAARDWPLLHGTGPRCTGRTAATRDGPPLHWTGRRCMGNAGIEGEKANALEVLEVVAASLKSSRRL